MQLTRKTFIFFKIRVKLGAKRGTILCQLVQVTSSIFPQIWGQSKAVSHSDPLGRCLAGGPGSGPPRWTRRQPTTTSVRDACPSQFWVPSVFCFVFSCPLLYHGLLIMLMGSLFSPNVSIAGKTKGKVAEAGRKVYLHSYLFQHMTSFFYYTLGTKLIYTSL